MGNQRALTAPSPTEATGQEGGEVGVEEIRDVGQNVVTWRIRLF
jgi:hypothetical protein